MWAEHDLIPGLWGLCITLVLVTPCILYAHCMVTGYVLGVREDRPEGAYGSVVLWLEYREDRLEDAWTRSGIMDPGCFSAQRQVGMGLGSQLSCVGPKDRYVVIFVLALFYMVGVTCFACTYGV